MTKAKTKMKADYTSLSPARNYWMEIMLLCVIVGVAVFSSSSIYRTNNNPGGINAPVAATTTTTTMMKANLVRGGVSNGDAGQEELSSTSVGDNYIKSVTNSFVNEEEEVEEGGGPLEGCSGFITDDLYGNHCWDHNGNEKSCKGTRGCHWYPHIQKGKCSSCAGVSCGLYRAPQCRGCSHYDGIDTGKTYCNGDCKWYGDDSGGKCMRK